MEEENKIVEKKKTTETVGILGFIFAFIFPFIGMILSIVGICKANKNDTPKGLPIAGLIISIIKIVIRLLLINFIIRVVIFGISNAESIGDSVTVKWDEFCKKAEKCEKAGDDFYNCEYKNKLFSFSIPCSEEQIYGEKVPDSERFSLNDIIDSELKDDIDDNINID